MCQTRSYLWVLLTASRARIKKPTLERGLRQVGDDLIAELEGRLEARRALKKAHDARHRLELVFLVGVEFELEFGGHAGHLRMNADNRPPDARETPNEFGG